MKIPGNMFCTFCGKNTKEIEILITAPNQHAICDECIDLCLVIIATKKAEEKVENAAGEGI